MQLFTVGLGIVRLIDTSTLVWMMVFHDFIMYNII